MHCEAAANKNELLSILVALTPVSPHFLHTPAQIAATGGYGYEMLGQQPTHIFSIQLRNKLFIEGQRTLKAIKIIECNRGFWQKPTCLKKPMSIKISGHVQKYFDNNAKQAKRHKSRERRGREA